MFEQTAAAIRNRVPVIYQGEFSCETALMGMPVTIVGRPDFLILDGDGYLIRDSKLSRQVDDDHHEEITLQLQLYGWLFEQTVGTPAKRLEVHTGKGDIVDVPYDGGVAALADLDAHSGNEAARQPNRTSPWAGRNAVPAADITTAAGSRRRLGKTCRWSWTWIKDSPVN